MERPIMLAFDVGTSGVKVSMIGADGCVVDTQTENYQTHYAPGGVAEQNPLDWWDGICRATRGVMDRNPDCRTSICAIGVSGHMLGCIPVASDGMPLMPCMIHSDSRAAAQYEEICRQIGADVLYQMSGNILDARSSLSKQLWVRQNRPQVYEKTAKFLQCKDFVVSRLTGNIDTTDYSDACHGELMDIRKRQYDPAIYQQLKLDTAKLPALHRGCDIVGSVTERSAKELGLASGIPVIAGGGDGACGSAGAANIRSGDAYLSLGSTAWIARVSDAPVIDAQGRLFNIINLDGQTSSVYGAMQAAGSSINWVKQLLNVADYDTLGQMAQTVEPGCGGLVYLPYLDGERSPVFDAAASGLFAGIGLSHRPEHFVRAVFEGVAFALRQIADIHRAFGSLEHIRAIGGGLKMQNLPQIIADVTGLSIQTLSIPHADATSLGVASVAGAAVGVYSSIDEALAYIKVKDTIAPHAPDRRYEQMYQIYLQLYPNMQQTMHAIRKFESKEETL